MTTPVDINKLIDLYVHNQASENERELVREYILEDDARCDIILEAMRRKAMEDLNINPENDFLPGHLKRLAPNAFAASLAFSQKSRETIGERKQASMLEITQKHSAFEILWNHLFEEE